MVGLVACSNALDVCKKNEVEELKEILQKKYVVVKESKYIYGSNGVISGTAKEKAEALMEMFSNPEMEEIYDISGGDLANQILDELDYEEIRKSKATFWGYSDLTTIINGIYAMTGKESVLYQIKNLVWQGHRELQQKRYLERTELFEPVYRWIQGNNMEGIVIGGNIRCFLKLAGTKYFPDMEGKILLLESCGGEVAQMMTYLSQLKQIGVFDKVVGIILGTFSMMEYNQCKPNIITLVKEVVGNDIPIVKTEEIGHGTDSKAIVIGKHIVIKNVTIHSTSL